MKLDGDRFFEVLNGHPGVRNWGDAAHPGSDRMWDIINAMRLTEGKPVLFGVATDDSHHYYEHAVGKSNSGRGWIMVRVEKLEPNAIILAMQRGGFYASTGVTLKDIIARKRELTVEIVPEKGVEYTIQFIGVLKGFDTAATPHDDATAHVSHTYSDEIGRVLQESKAASATYAYTDKELYVRAEIISTKKHPNPFCQRRRRDSLDAAGGAQMNQRDLMEMSAGCGDNFAFALAG